MRLVDQAVARPFRCAVIPFLSNQNAKGGFIDTGQHLDREHVYISLEAAVEIAKFIGWSGPSEVRARDEEVARLQAALDQAEAERDEAQAYIDSIEYVARGPMKPYKKPGRPKKETLA